MFKKNSWIVALLLALSLSVFFAGCIDVVSEEDTETYTEVELGDFNIGGGQTYQKGWAVGGILWNEGPASGAKDLGYLNEDFAGARYIVLKLTNHDGYSTPKGTVSLIWGAEVGDDEGATFGRWNQQAASAAMYEFTGATMKIDLSKALKDYTKYIDPSITKRKIVVQYVEGMTEVTGAILMIPDTPIPIPPTSFDLDPENVLATGVNRGYQGPARDSNWSPMKTTVDGKEYYSFNMDLGLAGFTVGVGLSDYDSIPGMVYRDYMTFEFDTTDEAIYFEFTDLQKELIRNVADSGFTAVVEFIECAGSGTGNSVIQGYATPVVDVRWTIVRPGGDGWNIGNWPSSASGGVAKFSTQKKGTFTTWTDKSPEISGIILQARNVTAGDTHKFAFASIKVTIPVEAVVDHDSKAQVFVFPKPYVASSNVTATLAVKSKDLTGTVEFLPRLGFMNRYAAGTVYTAYITLTPKGHNFWPVVPGEYLTLGSFKFMQSAADTAKELKQDDDVKILSFNQQTGVLIVQFSSTSTALVGVEVEP